jgi:hypothetical protein
LTTPDQIGKIVAERQSLKTKLPRDDARREQITALEQQSSNLSDLSARYTSYEKSRMALKAAAPYHKFVSVRVSPSQNRCWIRATMRPIIDEAMQNPTAYARVIDAIRSRPVQPENAPLLKLMERMHNTPSDQAKILNSTEFDNALAAYCRRVTFSIHNGSREPTDEEFNGMATAEKDARYNGYLLRHFNMSVNCLSASVDNQSPIGPLLPSSLVNDDTIFLTRHLLHGVPDHWNLLVAPAQASGGSGAAAAPPPANR